MLEVKSEALNLQLLVTGFHSLLLYPPPTPTMKKKKINMWYFIKTITPIRGFEMHLNSEARMPAKCSPIAPRTRQGRVSLIALERELK